MKIGVVTFFDVQNYGATLQAFALQAYLKNRGHEPFLVNCCYRKLCKSEKSLGKAGQFGAFWKRWRLARKNRPFIKMLSAMTRSRPYYSYEELKAKPPKADVYVVGSDQMWNLEACGQPETVFLDFGNELIRRVAYSVSFGAPEWRFADKTDYVRMRLQTFDCISVREESAIRVVAELGRSDAVCMPDPTLIVPMACFEPFIEPLKIAVPYLFVYSIGYALEPLRKEIDAVMAGQNLTRMVSQQRPSRGMPEKLNPFHQAKPKRPVGEWLGGMRDAACVVTDSFHGTMFAIRYHKPFLCYSIKNTPSEKDVRLRSALKSVGLEHRFNVPPERAAEVMAEPIDWEIVERRLLEQQILADMFWIGVEQLA